MTLRRTLAERLRTASYVRKWVVLGALIGAISGIGAVLFYLGLELAGRAFLGTIAGFEPATPVGEGGHGIGSAARPWAIPLVVALGGLVAGAIVFRFAPEAEGHGTDAAIEAFHHRPRGVRGRVPIVKLVASAVTIGSGGSGGREGPTAQIGAGFGSFLARTLDLDARDARIAVAAGMASGIGAIFRAPLGGALIGVEIPYRDDIEADALVPSFIASIVAFSIFGIVVGFSPIFGRLDLRFSDPRQLVWYALIGLLAGIVGRLYIATFYGATAWFRRWSVPRILRPAIAGFVVGCIGLAVPAALGTGYGWVQAGLDRSTLLSLPLWIVIALPFAKILATSLSIGSGGSGGVFGPGMVIGGLLGATVWRLLEGGAPAIPADPGPFVIVAMMALFGSIAHAPIAVMLMVAEMTGNLEMLAPAMLAIGVATVIVGDRSIYSSQLRTRAESPAHRFQYALPLMSTIPAGDVARRPRYVATADESADRVLATLRSLDLPGAPVVASDGTFVGSVSVDELVGAEVMVPVSELVGDDHALILAEDRLDEALGSLADHHEAWAPVVSDRRLVGVLSMGDAIAGYRRALAASARRIRSLGPTGELLRVLVDATSPLMGRTVAQIPWPRHVVLVTIERGGDVLVARGDVAIALGDVLTLFAIPGSIPALETLVATRLEPASAGE